MLSSVPFCSVWIIIPLQCCHRASLVTVEVLPRHARRTKVLPKPSQGDKVSRREETNGSRTGTKRPAAATEFEAADSCPCVQLARKLELPTTASPVLHDRSEILSRGSYFLGYFIAERYFFPRKYRRQEIRSLTVSWKLATSTVNDYSVIYSKEPVTSSHQRESSPRISGS